MTEANKKSIRDVSFILGGFALFLFIVNYVPEGSIGQKIIAILMVAALIIGVLWFTALGNPIKRLIRKIKGDKNTK